MRKRPGIYVEAHIRAPLEELWRRTQHPALHQRWDLRFTDIQYLPKGSEDAPQRFLYATRIGFGLRIAGEGESTGTRSSDGGAHSSALKFWSEDPKSLIRTGSGYWKYVPAKGYVQFLTWYDYETRFGAVGALADRLCFRPLIGWATAWSFDSLRLWLEREQQPESSLAFAGIHAISRVAVAFVWLWHGLVPKLMFADADELAMLAASGVSAEMLPWVGAAELVLALATLSTWRWRGFFLLNAAAMVVALVTVALTAPGYLSAAFNPVTLNGVMIVISAMGYLAAGRAPFAARCRRCPEKEAS